MSARGRFITLQLSDQFGIFDLSIFSEEVLKNYVHLLDVKTSVIANCDVFKDEGGIKITAKSFTGIEDIIKDNKITLKLMPSNHSELKEIINVLHKCINSDNNINIILFLPTEENFVAKVNLAENFYIENSDLLALKAYCNYQT